MSVRFSPDACPGCGDPLRPKYSTYRSGTRGLLFPLGLLGGMAAVLVLFALTFWAAAVLTEQLVGNAGLLPREKGAVMFLLQIPMVALIVWGARVGWGALHRLPKTFACGCETCTWTGPCKVYETADC